MGILDALGEVAGVIAAVEAVEKADPNAGLLTKGIAAVAGLKGAGALESLLEHKDSTVPSGGNDASPDDAAQA